MSALSKNVPGGTWILLAILVLPIVWLFATQETDTQKRENAEAAFFASIPTTGTVGRWYDDVGSKKYGDATITITVENGRYVAKRVSGDGSKTDLPLVRSKAQINIFDVPNDKLGARYIVTPEGLEIHDFKGHIRTAKPVAQ